uniref:Photosystem I assembly protein Ycf4 n=1 Tax=Cryptoglena skujai TaxID=161229 RepID=A0A0G3SH13_9EUGL|nr:photosystem I assembly protein ycf4 [Cryptoglena skujai]AKL39055.1 photosystem I assembly protein ycf4 [Cryptoglena skujai]
MIKIFITDSSSRQKNNIINETLLLRDEIIEEYKIYKVLLSSLVLTGSLGFIIIGLSCYLTKNLVPFLDASKIVFFPQGITMLCYGIIGTVLTINQLIILYYNVGEGYNEFNKEKNIMKIFRKGFPGKNSDVIIEYPLNDIEALRIEIKTDLFNTKQKIYACIKGKNDIPIYQPETPLKINEIEGKVSKLASFLKVSVRGL